ncbi:hypothetical protein [Rhizobium sp. NFR07]|uniref:hypothetical protein n=1 Tax=Rhizobium sp. NFR07 TaxID=1566262 RepID=UPI0011607BB5|nr:hypothetical protein [Rhizobium sp. NFR07]
MSYQADDGTRQLGEAICATCGSGLMFEGEKPKSEDIVWCANDACRTSAVYAEVAADCAAWYREYSDFLMQRVALGASPLEVPLDWKPRRRLRFGMKIVATGHVKLFGGCNAIPLNH